MKLERFYIKQFRVLRELDLDFVRGGQYTTSLNPQHEYALDFLAGVNGTGKTTVLHLLGRLFAWLEEQDHFSEAIELAYALGTTADQQQPRRVTVTTIPERVGETDPGLWYRVDSGQWKKGKIREDLLPRHVIIYTTGSEEEWDNALALEESDSGISGDNIDEQEEASAYLYELPGHQPDWEDYEEKPFELDLDRRILFIKSGHLPLVTLCGLIASRRAATSNREVLADVLASVGIESLSGFSLRIRAYPNLTHPAQLDIITRLQEAANRIVQQGSDRLLVFDMAQQPVQPGDSDADPSIFTLYSSPIELFQNLLALYEHRPYYDPPLQEVNLFLRRIPYNDDDDAADAEDSHSSLPMLHLFDWLSDGEQSFLARMALFALFQEDDLLILLDEPEVHFNDVWKREIVNMLDSIMRGHASHALITTHSSIALSDVRSQDILVLRRDGAFATSEHSSQLPGIETFGADPSDILVHVFGTRSASGERGVRFIREEIGRRNTRAELEELEQIVAPGYWRYRIQLEARRLEGTLQ